jgi:hypothetical protein
MCAFGDGFFAH